jgi:hypothetical protein
MGTQDKLPEKLPLSEPIKGKGWTEWEHLEQRDADQIIYQSALAQIEQLRAENKQAHIDIELANECWRDALAAKEAAEQQVAEYRIHEKQMVHDGLDANNELVGQVIALNRKVAELEKTIKALEKTKTIEYHFSKPAPKEEGTCK